MFWPCLLGLFVLGTGRHRGGKVALITQAIRKRFVTIHDVRGTFDQVCDFRKRTKAMRALDAALHVNVLISFLLELVRTSDSTHAACDATFDLVTPAFSVGTCAERTTRTNLQAKEEFEQQCGMSLESIDGTDGAIGQDSPAVFMSRTLLDIGQDVFKRPEQRKKCLRLSLHRLSLCNRQGINLEHTENNNDSIRYDHGFHEKKT